MIDNEILECQKFLHPENPTDLTSEDVKKYFKELGWEEGDKIPEGMQEYTTAVLHALGKPVSIRSLPSLFDNETVKLTIKSALNKTKVFLAEKEEVDNKVKQLVPNADNLNAETASTLLDLATKAVEEEIKEHAEIDTEIDGLSDVIEEEEKEKEEIKEVKAEEKHRFCPRCMWDVYAPYEPFPITEEDKINYLYSLINGSGFSKEYTVAKGLLKITFTAPSAYVNQMIDDQIKLDTIHGVITDFEQSFVYSSRYNLAASLTSIKSTKTLDNNPPIPDIRDEKFKDSEGNNTNIRAFTKYIEENVIKSSTRESLFREAYNNFYKLQITLNRTLESENFSQAVLDKIC